MIDQETNRLRILDEETERLRNQRKQKENKFLLINRDGKILLIEAIRKIDSSYSYSDFGVDPPNSSDINRINTKISYLNEKGKKALKEVLFREVYSFFALGQQEYLINRMKDDEKDFWLMGYHPELYNINIYAEWWIYDTITRNL